MVPNQTETRPSSLSGGPYCKFSAASFVDRKWLRKISIFWITHIVEICRIKHIFSYYRGPAVQERFNEPENGEIVRASALEQKDINVTAHTPQRVEHVTLTDLHQIKQANRVQVGTYLRCVSRIKRAANELAASTVA